jgi:hypothetical protein
VSDIKTSLQGPILSFDRARDLWRYGSSTGVGVFCKQLSGKTPKGKKLQSSRILENTGKMVDWWQAQNIASRLLAQDDAPKPYSTFISPR